MSGKFRKIKNKNVRKWICDSLMEESRRVFTEESVIIVRGYLWMSPVNNVTSEVISVRALLH